MPKFLIERELPGAGQLTADQLRAISQTSCGVLQEMGPQIQWLQSYVTGDKITCVYIAPDAEQIREHAARGGFPADRVLDVLHEPRFVDLAPAQVYATLLDEGRYLSSERTMYRILAAEGEASLVAAGFLR